MFTVTTIWLHNPMGGSSFLDLLAFWTNAVFLLYNFYYTTYVSSLLNLLELWILTMMISIGFEINRVN